MRSVYVNLRTVVNSFGQLISWPEPVTVQHHPRHVHFPPESYTPKYINPDPANPMHDVVEFVEGGTKRYRYADRVRSTVELNLITVTESECPRTISTLEKITFELLPPVSEKPTKPLPIYEVRQRVEEVVPSELFDQNNPDKYLSARLQQNPDISLVEVTYGEVWGPELTRTIISHLKQSGINVDDVPHGLGGHIIQSDRIVLKR